MPLRSRIALLTLVLACAACASLGSLGQLVQPPRFENAAGRVAELRILAPSLERPLGGASVRVWARVQNPNPMAVVLSQLQGTLLLQDTQAAQVDFPLGLPLPAAADTVVPLDIAVNFSDLPALADVVTRALGTGEIPYRLRGTATLDAGALGSPSFGPMTLLQGVLDARR